MNTSSVAKAANGPTLPRAWDEWLDLRVSDRPPDLQSLYQRGQDVLPERRNVFRAFELVAPTDVRVVLLGQDPYDTSGLADGLAFSQQGEVDKRSALHRIFLNLERDPDIQFARPATGNLTEWATGGVLLLNTALTVFSEKPKSHLRLWKPFIETVIRRLAASGSPIAFVVLGEDARKIAMPLLRQVPREAIIRAAHPVASNTGQRPFKGAYVFSEANQFLGDRVINWSAISPST
ncbi:uracil-DNA glycosylase [Microbacterium sp. CGR1]|uniref:uracil-DNA glycosylase n=1 Tax=Microbacterium sp. CGR1 TaxID=1696072 RepID=UPI001493EA69|nr:uracil-DNA glycosylase [Microbacterium sp. CGR1]